MMARRAFVRATAAATAAAVMPEAARASEALVVRRLSWAGVRLEAGGVTLFVDPWEDVTFFGGRFPGVPIEVSAGTPRRYVALTHLHRDHFDREVVKRLFAAEGAAGAVVVEASSAAEVASAGLPVLAQRLWEPRSVGPFTLTPLPAVDGWGAEQVAWSIRVGGVRLFHGGDGLWHGRWWDFARAHGPYDVAFLPINGVRTPGGDPAVGVARTLGPAEAAEAARALGAARVVPIHYGVSVPGVYEETPDAEGIFLARAAELGLVVEKEEQIRE